MTVITISRQDGSLGDEIARDVAEKLGLRLVGQEMINEVAQRLGVSPGAVTNRDEREPGLAAELVRTMRRLYPATVSTGHDESDVVDESSYLQMIRQLIWELARGDDVVIVGRGASFILGRNPDILHVLLVAPLEIRVERVMAAEGIGQRTAAQRIREVDASRARYIRHHYGANWLDVTQYDLVLNTGHFSQLKASEIVCAAAPMRPATD
ncbi:MAG TPA: cytidylate kinase-like family protein [Chloroflexota bacterium]|nr:cytidylate kinase-like family protein [Chloroflexota bacterium]